MNTIYKVIWNDALRVYQVVNELAHGRRKGCSASAVHRAGSVGGAVGFYLAKPLVKTAVSVAVAMVLAGSSMMAEADPYIVDGVQIDMGGNSISNAPTITTDDLLGFDGITINLLPQNITATGNFFSQDEGGTSMTVASAGTGVDFSNWNINWQFNNAAIQNNQITISDQTGSAEFLYDLLFETTASRIRLERVLKNIKLVDGRTLNFTVAEEDGADFKASITGSGSISFDFGSIGGVGGFVTLTGEDANTYTGNTLVGFSSDGTPSAGPTTIYFGKTKAFGDTALLNVDDKSSVYIGGKDRDQDYAQTVHGLSGTGLIDLGSYASLTLDQKNIREGSVIDGYLYIDNGQEEICGEAYLIADGKTAQISALGETAAI